MSIYSNRRSSRMQTALIVALCVVFAAGGGVAQARVEREIICHIPPDNPARARTIEVALPAVLDHLAHGDTLGPCPDGQEPPPEFFSTRSVALDGLDDFVNMGGVYEFAQASDVFSLSLWYKANTAGEAHLIGQQNPGAIRRGYFVHLDSNANVCFSLVANATASPSPVLLRECTSTPPALGAWHHVCVTVGGRSFATTKIYVDGVEASTTPSGVDMSSNAFANSGANFTVGAASCASGASCLLGGIQTQLRFPFSGNVDEAAIWDSTELGPDQVDEIYASGKPSDLGSTTLAPPPTSWWRMGECTATDGTNVLICDENLLVNRHGLLVNGAMISTDVP